jgi:hypothetical protein
MHSPFTLLQSVEIFVSCKNLFFLRRGYCVGAKSDVLFTLFPLSLTANKIQQDQTLTFLCKNA